MKRCDCFKLQMRQAPLSAKEELTSRDCTESFIGQQMTSLRDCFGGRLGCPLRRKAKIFCLKASANKAKREAVSREVTESLVDTCAVGEHLVTLTLYL